MAAFFGNLRNVVIAGFVLAIGVAAIYVGCLHGSLDQAFWLFITRWLHVASGVMWIGLLWYFNFVQVPTMPSVPAELKPAVTKYIAPAALFWFRWAAMATIILGIGLAGMNHYLVQAYTLDAVDGFTNTAFVLIGIGMWLGTIMWFNVWFIIWPNQQKVLNIGGKFSDLAQPAKDKAAKAALIASRFNTMASIPMLFCMVAASHI
ncbi:MAG TPA: urate hydroxylase PuuD [Rhizomicrobium sp.]|nr:urate hydroxylase PuuD [Rhizomicrobium sp.]